MSTRDIYEYTKGEYQTITLIKQSDATAAAKYITFMGVDMAGYDITIYSDSAGASPLTEGLDYTLMYKDTLRSVAESKNIYAGYRIDTVVYQGVPLWVSMKTVGGYTKYLGVPNTFNPRSFTAGRYDSQEVQSGALSPSGWYKVAKFQEPDGNLGASADFSFNVFGHSRSGGMTAKCNFHAGDAPKTSANVNLEITGRSRYNITSLDRYGVLGVRYAKSDSIHTSGCFVEVLLDIGTTVTLTTQVSNNISNGASGGFDLISPVASTGLCPDGSSATYYEAGAVFEPAPVGTAQPVPDIQFRRANDDSASVTVIWPELPKSGTGLSITLPNTALIFYDRLGNTATITSNTITSFATKGKKVFFSLTQVGAFAGFTDGPTSVRTYGDGFKLTIT